MNGTGYAINVIVVEVENLDWCAMYVNGWRAWHGHYSDLSAETIADIADGRSVKLAYVRVAEDDERLQDSLRPLPERWTA